MTPDLLAALIGFALVTSATPGPSNLILLASGLNFGFRRCLPLILGINLGFVSMLLLVGLGLGRVLRANQELYLFLRIPSLLYLLWLAWKIARSGPLSGRGRNPGGRPLNFWQAAALQWVNPKAWAVALTATVAYTRPENYGASLAIMIPVFALVNLPAISLWALFGAFFRRLLIDPAKVRVFNLVMALLLVASTVPIVFRIGQ